MLLEKMLKLGKAKLPENASELQTMLAEYDLVGTLKKDCIPQVFIPATDECPTLSEFVRFSDEVGGILAYAYLGDVTSSVTGDKKAQKFEDDYLDELFETIYQAGIRAVTYMPTRNTQAQIERLRICRGVHFSHEALSRVLTGRGAPPLISPFGRYP